MDVKWSHTSGTTGQGLKLPETAECFQREFAYRIHSYSLGGVKFGNRWAWCAGHPVTYINRKKPPFWAHDYLNNWLLMSSYHLSKSNLPYYIKKLSDFKPELIAGYPSSIYLLALVNRKSKHKVTPKAVVTSSETLFQNQRAIIEDSFGCKAFIYYGSGERAAAIAECEKGKYHLRTEYSFMELVNQANKPVGKSEEGRMVCTAFGNYAIPLIRYDVGDVAKISNDTVCDCGRQGVIVENVVGRAEDFIFTPDNKYIGRLDHLFKDSLNVRMAQIIQETIDSIIIRIVKEPSYGRKDENEILKEARNRLGAAMKINFEYVDDITRSKSGKHQFIVQRLSKGLHT